MANLTHSDTNVVQDLRNSIRECTSRGLLFAAKWRVIRAPLVNTSIEKTCITPYKTS
ncbi:hypothetical protein HHX47_DHR2001191, partial [Lentinula edodes]